MNSSLTLKIYQLTELNKKILCIFIKQEKIHEEIEYIFGGSDRPPSLEDLNKMKYTECCIKESLRIYPSVPFISRYIKKEIVLGKIILHCGKCCKF